MITNTLYTQPVFGTVFTPSPHSGIGIDPKEILNAQLADSIAVLVLSILAMAVGIWLVKLFSKEDAPPGVDTGLASILALMLMIGGLLFVHLEVRNISRVIFSPNVVIYEATKSLTK